MSPFCWYYVFTKKVDSTIPLLNSSSFNSGRSVVDKCRSVSLFTVNEVAPQVRVRQCVLEQKSPPPETRCASLVLQVGTAESSAGT